MKATKSGLSALAATIAEDFAIARAREYFARVDALARAERDALALARGRTASDRAAYRAGINLKP